MTRLRRAVFVPIVVLLSPMSAYAIPFTIELDFQAAAGSSLNVEEFDAIADGTQISELASLGITFIDQGDGLPAVLAYSSAMNPVVDSAPHAFINRPTIDNQSRQSYFFSATDGSLITAVGLNNIGRDDGLILRFFDASNQLMESMNIGNGGTPIFGGIVNFVGATTVEIAWDGTLGNGLLGIDGLQVALRSQGGSHSVPEPSTLALIGIGLLGMGASRRKETWTSKPMITKNPA